MRNPYFPAAGCSYHLVMRDAHGEFEVHSPFKPRLEDGDERRLIVNEERVNAACEMRHEQNATGRPVF